MKAKAKGSVQRLTCHHSPRSLQPHHVQHPLLHTHVHLHGLRMSIVDMTEHRLVIKGSLRLNDQYDLTPGMWFVVRSGTPYEIHTTEGYTTLGAYTSVCQTNRGADGAHLEVTE